MIKMKKKVDPSQFDLFAGTEFEPVIKEVEKPKQKYIPITPPDVKSEKDIILWFAKKFKHSLAFLDCALSGLLPGDYHGTPLFVRKINDVWIDESNENEDYWIRKDFKIFNSNKINYIIKPK